MIQWLIGARGLHRYLGNISVVGILFGADWREERTWQRSASVSHLERAETEHGRGEKAEENQGHTTILLDIFLRNQATVSGTNL